MFRPDRSGRRGPSRPSLEWKVRIFVIAAVLGLSGIYLDEAWLTGGAILLLLAGVLLRFASGTASPEDPAEGDDEDP